jgi:small-conductance mechanosensitive channel
MTFNLIVSGLIVVAATFAMLGVRRSLGALKKRMPKTDVGKIGNWARVGIVVLAVLLILNLFGTPLTALITTIGTVCGVLAVGFFATWSTLSNFPCTFYLVLTKPFSVGDDLEMIGDDVKGKVVDITLAYTVLQDNEGYHVNIPNGQFMQKQFRRKSGNVSIPLGEQLRKSAPVKVAVPIKPLESKPAQTPVSPAATPPPAAVAIATPAIAEKKSTLPVGPPDIKPAATPLAAPEVKKFKIT